MLGMVARITPSSHEMLLMQSKGNDNLSNHNAMPGKNNNDGEYG